MKFLRRGDSSSNNNSSNSTSNSNRNLPKGSLVAKVTISIHICTSLFLLYGLWLRISFQNGNECDMTWSVITFVHLTEKNNHPQIDNTTNTQNHPFKSKSSHSYEYRLLRFIDGRDERYTHLIDYKNPDTTNDEDDTYHLKPEFTYENNDNNDSNDSNNWCQPNPTNKGNVGHIVLYIPGHGGQFKQARSVAAHGVDLSTRFGSNKAVLSLKDGTKNKESKDVNDFVYDVYTVDFNNEGGAWHASALYAQVDFVVKSIKRLVEECHLEDNDESITIVAHSIGGLVARKAILALNGNTNDENGQGQPRKGRNIVNNVITLASPHEHIPLIIEQSVTTFHEELVLDEKKLMDTGEYDTTLVSFSGGLRDELIPPQYSFFHYRRSEDDNEIVVEDEDEDELVLSVLATDVMPSRVELNYDGPRFGMDHKCIVWCHGLLAVVRELIHIFVSLSGETKLEQERQISHFLEDKMMSNAGLNCRENNASTSAEIHLNAPSDVCGENENECGYSCRTKHKESLLRDKLGLFGAISMKATMLYNIHTFALMYVLNAVLCQVLYFLSQQRGNRSLTNRTQTLTGCYFICPILSFLIYRCIGANDMNRNTIVPLLAVAAMSVYSIILSGIIPFILWLSKKLKEFKKSKEFLTKKAQDATSRNATSPTNLFLKHSPLQLYIWRQIKLIFISILIHSICCLLTTILQRQYDWVLNGRAIASHCLIIFIITTLLNTIQVGFCHQQSTNKQTFDSECSQIGEDVTNIFQYNLHLHCQMIATLLLPISPLLVLGKLFYCSSLLTNGGQQRALTYILYQQKQLASDSDFSFVLKVFIPINLILFAIEFFKIQDAYRCNGAKKVR